MPTYSDDYHDEESSLDATQKNKSHSSKTKKSLWVYIDFKSNQVSCQIKINYLNV